MLNYLNENLVIILLRWILSISPFLCCTHLLLATDSPADSKAVKAFLVCNHNALETFHNLLWQIQSCKSNGYTMPVPPHPLFKDLEEYPEKLKSLDMDKYFKVFVSEIFKPLDLTPLQDVVNKNTLTLLAALDKLQILHQRWGFHIYPQYKIVPVLYSPGGSYHAEIGEIEIRVDEKGIPLISREPIETIIHEIVHIGIEEIIVKKFQLSHWEKEGLVDMICSSYLKEFLPNYNLQSLGDKRIKAFIRYDKIYGNLPVAIKEYSTSNSRKFE